MKKLLLILFMFLSVCTTYSQAPQGFNYQAIVRDANGNIRSNQGVQFIFEIRNAAGDAVYTEAHTTITNKYGLADDIIIGQGSTADNFSNINWGTGTYFVNVKVDGVDMGTTQLLSVPYALYALSAGSGAGGEDGEDGVGIESTVDNKDGSFTLNYTDGTSFTTVDLRGATGADGKSAYEVWLDLGNTGTAADFLLTLTGPEGEKGEKGEKGDDAVITGGASSVVTDDLDTSRVLVSNIAGKIAVSGISSTELNSLDNVKSNVQTQIDGKQALNDNLTRVSAMNPTDGSIIVGDGIKFVTEEGATARTSLGLGTLSTQDANAVLINGGSITGIADISIFDGGTGASTAKQARLNLNVDSAGTDNSTDVSLTQVPSNYLTLSGQEITAGIVPVELGGTGGASIVAARENLGLGTMAVQDNYNVSITGGEVKGITDLAVADGGTGASTAPAARTNLGLGTISTQNSNNVSISGGKITGAELSGLSTDIAIADGGTGSSTASGARTNLGLAIGSDVQAYDEELDDIASLDPTLNNFIVGNGTAFVKKNASDSRDALNLGSIATQNVNNIKITGGTITGVTDIAIADGGTGASTAESARSNLGLAIGSDVQAYDAELKAIAGLTSMANKGIQFTGAGSAATFDLTNAAKTLLDDADVAAMRTTLGVNLSNLGITSTASELNILDGVTATAAEINTLDGITSTTAELNILDGVTATAAELNTLDGITSTTAELNILDGVTATAAELNTLDGITSSTAELNILDGVNATAAELNTLDGITSTTAELNILDGVTATAAEINTLDGITSTTAELNILDGVTATATEINLIDGVTATTAEINYVDGVTSNIQTQLDAKQTAITDGDLTIARTSGLQTALDAKQATVTGAATTIVSSDLTVSRALTSNGSGKVAVSDVTATELGYLDGVTSSIQTQLDAKQATIGDGDLSIARTSGLQTALDAKQATVTGAATTIASSDLTASRALTSNGSGKVAVSDVTSTELSVLDGITSTTSELNILDGVTATTAELNILDGVTATAAELNILDGVTSTAAELNILDGVTATANELNLIDGVTATTAEINYVDGVTSNIQTQLDAKQATITNGSVTNAQLAGSIANAKLANSSVSYGGIELALGATDATPAFNLADATNLPIDNISGIKANASNFSNSLLIGQSSTGNLSNADYNVGVGYGVFSSLTSGTGNMANGYNALNSLTTGTGNVAIGRQVLSKITTGSKNVGIGRQAGIQIVGGSVGGTSLVNGNNNTYIGAETVPSASDVSNETVIGYGATGLGSNYAVIGNADVTRVYAAQDAGATLYAGGLNIGGTAVTATATELNLIDGVTATTAEINYLDGVTSNIQTQLNSAGGASNVTGLSDALVDGDESMYIGNDPSSTTNSAIKNVALGVKALDAITTGDWNTALGFEALSSNTTGSNNAASGTFALFRNTTGNYNTATGYDALTENTTGANNTASGYRALRYNTTGSQNTATGSNALNSNTTGISNTASGYAALLNNTTGSNNTATGRNALSSNTAGLNNTALGYGAGDVITTGSNNVLIGYQADPSALDASNQIVIGKGATGVGDNYAVIGNADVTRVYASQDAGATLYAGGLNIGGTAVTSTAAELNILDGVTATATELNLIDGVTATTAEINYLDGVTSNIQTQLNSAGGASNVTGLSDALVEDNSVYIGNNPSSSTNSAQYNVAVGTTALDGVTSGDKIVAVGYDALTSNTSGSSNTALGMYALRSNTSGNLNTAVGNESLKSNTIGANNTAVGWESLSANTTGSNNTGSGLYVLRNNTSGDYNTAMGYEAGDVITTGSYNVILGNHADPSANNATNQIVIGKGATGQGDNYAVIGNADVTRVYAAQDAGATLYAGGLNIGGTAITANAAEINYLDGVTSNIQTQLDNAGGGASNVNGLSDALVENNSIFIGNDPSSTTSTAEKNVALGVTALDAITTGDFNIAVGYDALTSNTTGSNNTASGTFALYSNTTGSQNTALGFDALAENIDGIYNTASGYRTLRYNTSGQYNTAMGYKALYTNSSGVRNSALGSFALYANETGQYNTAMGYQAGNVITTGSNNVIIGYDADPSANNASNQIVIGKDATGQGDNYAVIGNANVTRVYAAQDEGATLYAAGMESSAGSISIASTLADGQTLKLGKNGAVEMIISPHGTAANETFSLTNTSGTDNGAIAITATAGGISATVADEKDLTLGNAVLDAYFKVAASATAGSEDVRIVNTNGTDEAAIALTSSAGGVDVDAAAAKDVNIAGGQVALVSKDDAASAISLTANQGTSETIVITNTQGTSSSAIDINAIAGGVTVDAGSGISIDAGAASNLTTSAGALTIDGDAGVNLAGNSSEIDVTTSGIVDINSAILDIDASGAITIDGSSVSIEGLTYPGSDGTNGQVLSTNGSGTLSWSNASGASNVTGLSDALIESNSLYLGNDPSGTTTNTAQKNIAVGTTALDAITSGSSNTAVGYDALTALTSGASNTAIGENSLSSLTDGTANVALGRSTMYSNTSGDYNVAVGHGAAGQLTTGGHNTAIGYNALRSVTTGLRNLAIGSNTAYNATGSDNTLVGVGAATALTSGNYNTFLGEDAGDVITTGSSNTYLGSETDASANSVSNETAIGANAIGQGSNTVTVGDDNVTAVYLSEDKGATVYAGALDVTASGGITLENDETITNSTDGTVAIGGNLTGTGSISGFDANLNDQTGTTYTLTSSDNGKVITLNNANAITLTIAASLGDGFNCLIVQKGAGQVTLSAAGGVTVVNRSSETKTAGQYATVSIINIGSEQYILSGDTGS